MTMKRSTLLLSFILFANLLFAQTIFEPDSKIESVIVYERGAMVTRTVDVSDITSDGTISIDSLPEDINIKSIRAKCGEGLKIVSILNTQNFIRIYQNEKKDSIESLIKVINDSIDFKSNLLTSIDREVKVILKNDKFSTEEGTDIAQLSQAADLYKSRLRELNLEHLVVTKERQKLRDEKDELNRQINNLGVKKFNNLGVEIKVEYESEVDKSLTISYFSPSASWYTFYDLRVNENQENSHLDHKAFVTQNTGEDWTDVMLTLSNRNPNKRIAPPIIRPYILQNTRHHGYSQPTIAPSNLEIKKGYLTGIITDESGEVMIGANVMWKGTALGTVTDIDGRFILKNSKSSRLVVSYIGYETQEVDVSNLASVGIALEPGQLLDEVVVTGLGIEKESKSMGYAVSATDLRKKRMKAEVRKAISVKPQKSLNVHSFEILKSYTIPSNGKEYDVLLNSNTIPFEYEYVTMPSVEPTAYLNVGIPNWNEFNLLSGKVNLFLEGQYTGVSQLNIESKTDTLWFSLGEDIGVQVEKDVVQEYNKKSFLKNKTIELHTFDILVKNNKNKAVEIDILDQVPISTDDDIKVKVHDISGASYDKKKGFLEWKARLNPNEGKKYRVSYEIKYGKNVDIVSN